MLLSVRTFEVPALGAKSRYWGLSAPGLWLNLLETEQLGADEAVIGGLGHGRSPDGRVVHGVTLRGSTFVRMPDDRIVETHAGQVAWYPGRGSFRSGIVPGAGRTFSMTVEMERTGGPREARPDLGRVSDLPRARALAEALAAQIEHAWRTLGPLERVERTLGELFGYLRSEGIALEHDLAGPQTASELQRVGRAVDIAVSTPGSIPTLVDVERRAARSRRSVQRDFGRLCARWGQAPESFRSFRRRSTLSHAVRALSVPGARTDVVSDTLGFSSPSAFCRAMRSYGLATPSAISSHFRQLS